ncbi:MAG TPA: sugar phosphate isomerase/epimerase [Streptosporangiaceae bacterium]
MQVGLFTDAFTHLSLTQTLAWCAAHGIESVELGTGGYSPAPHADLERLSSSEAARQELLGELASTDVSLGALNVSGNPLHPNPQIATLHDAQLRSTVRLAQELGVTRVVAMSGCPGGPGDASWPVFAGGAWLPDMERLWDWQWAERIAPYWGELSRWASQAAPDVRICLELHPGTSIYNAESFRLLREVTGDNVMVNLDPSHFWWQGMDPVRVIEDLTGLIGWSHGKDTLIRDSRMAVIGCMDFRWPRPGSADMPWHFCAVGAGHAASTWVSLVKALIAAGHDHTISIEHEDPDLTAEDGALASLLGLREVLSGLEP